VRFSRHVWWLYLALTAKEIIERVPRRAAERRTGLQRDRLQRLHRDCGRRPRHRPAARWPWYLIALGQFLFVSGDVLAYNYHAFFGKALPFPSIADPLYLAVYPVTVTGLLLLIRHRNRGRDCSIARPMSRESLLELLAACAQLPVAAETRSRPDAALA
jgi:hypothetical protein